MRRVVRYSHPSRVTHLRDSFIVVKVGIERSETALVPPDTLMEVHFMPGPPQPDSPTIRIAFFFYKRILSPIAHAISPTQCLYLPTCSEYAYVALHRFGLFKGSWLTLKRLARCHPFAKGGLDPVPELVSQASAPLPPTR